MFRCQHCPARMEIRRKNQGTLWVCPKCGRMAATIGAWEKAQADVAILQQFKASSRGKKATGGKCPACKKSTIAVSAESLQGEYCKSCVILSLTDWRSLLPEKSLGKGVPEASAEDKQIQNEAVVAVVSMVTQGMQEEDDNVIIERTSFATYGLLALSFLWLLGGGLGVSLTQCGFEVMHPFKGLGLTAFLYPLYATDFILILLCWAVLWYVGRQVEDEIGGRQLTVFWLVCAGLSAVVARLFFSEGDLAGLGGITTATVVLHNMLFPNRQITIRPKRYHMSGAVAANHNGKSSFRVPFLVVYPCIYAVLLLRRAEVIAEMTGNVTELHLTLADMVPHVVGIIVAIVWAARWKG